MPTSTQTTLNGPLQAWPAWNALGLNQRAEILTTWASSLEQQKIIEPLAASMVNYQIKQGHALISEKIEMPGPTGEVNHLSTSGRGLFVIAAHQEVTLTAIVGFMSAALIAGNGVILSLSKQQDLASKLCMALHQLTADTSIATVIEPQLLIPMIKSPDIAGVALMGDSREIIEINQCLVARQGQIAQLITESDFDGLPTLTDPYLLFRFITEKTQTVNITAVGGNATLLALGCGDQ